MCFTFIIYIYYILFKLRYAFVATYFVLNNQKSIMIISNTVFKLMQKTQMINKLENLYPFRFVGDNMTLRVMCFLWATFQSRLHFVRQTYFSAANDVICKPPTTLPPVTCRALTLCSPVPPPLFPLRPLPHRVGSQGRAGGQTCQSNLRRHAATP